MTRLPADPFRVCLISPPFDREKVYSTLGFAAPIEPPLGLAFVAGMVRSKGFDVRLFDATTLGYDMDDLARILADWRPQVVGVAANSPVYPISIDVTRMIRRVLPSATIVVGGCHPTLYPARAIANASVDAVVVGEGEHAFTEICTAVSEGRWLDGIAGVVHERDGQVVHEPARPFVKDLDTLPFPTFDLLPMQRYRISLGIAGKTPAVSMVASRGCPMNCKFCTSPGLWKRQWRHHSPRYIGDVLELLVKEHGVRHIQFRDDTFTINEEWVLGICDEFLRRKLRLTWDCYSTVGLIRESMMRRMRQAGCTCLSIGIESGNDEMLRKYKQTSKAEVREKMALLRRLKMRARLFFMLAPPAEKHSHLQETLDFALELNPHFAMFLPTIPLPGSRLYDELVAEGRDPPDYDHELQDFQQVLYAPPPFTREELDAFRGLCYRKFYFRPSYILRFLPYLMNLDSMRRGFEAMRQLPRFLRPPQ